MSSSSSSAPQPVKLSLPLAYQQNLFQELRTDDELVVLARGLGLMRLVTNLLHSYDAAGNNLVLVVNADDRENGWIGEALAEHAAISMAPRARGLTVVNTDFTTVGAREKMYAAGGIFSVTSRILVVDLLTSLLNPTAITGVVVLHADRVVATSLEAFILRIYRQKNKVGFLKAFSDNPEAFATGFAPLATMMRNLFLRKASLWPRFHVTVATALEGKKRAEVVEFEVAMTDSMRDIQNAILECVEVSIHELKKSNTGLDMEDWNLDSALLKNFDVMVRRQLDPNWHRVSWKSKQIVGDLTVLRGMLQSIVECDAVAFLQRLDTIHAAHSPPPGSTRQSQSPWLFLDAAQTIFDTAKRRVYTGKHNFKSSNGMSGLDGNNTSSSNTLRPVLEEQPKWSVLGDILEEIDRDLYHASVPRDDSNGTILIMCGDVDTCRQLRDFLQTMHVRPRTESRVEEFFDAEEDRPSGAFMMRRKLRNYLKWKSEFANVNATLFAENQKALSGAIDPRTGRPAGAVRSNAPANKRRRVRGGGSGMGQANTASAIASASVSGGRAANGSVAQYFEKPNEVAELMAEIHAAEAGSTPGTSTDGGINTDAEIAAAQQKADILAALADPLEDMDDFYQMYDMSDLVVIHAYDGDQDEHVLEEVKPRYIIMYEPDAAFIRRIEVYRSSHNDRSVRTYFMYYGGSVEEQKYLSAVRREKDAFTKLIKERASMAVTLTTTASHNISNADDPQESFLRTVNTRIAGGGRLTTAATTQPRVVVDVREFRSSLPSLLHGRNMAVVPCMLTVGDYVLSDHICVERKSISDLISSFRDGRLYTQCETMFQHYRDPMLLIEFDMNKSFTLEPFADLASSSSSGSSVIPNPQNANDLQSKIVLLTLAFPRLRILWASSPYETAEIFERLKSHEAEPDPVAAVRAGLDPHARADDQPFNLEPQEMLAAVPGVTPANLRTLVMETESIAAIAAMDAPELEPIVGKESARQISEFFKKDIIEEAG
ncbi:DNA excision repair protein ERCC-4 [Sporothrix brasiliensis 5110]|uniref:DNA excision repair protein ERCC-4 n=1 Tax=Sporothrix brasiliensis 5110 TaxID=1398154 RepID=A0A0C2FKE0_9PEZI|nr:DNA excision repair protein ERCC-4 [Sporothrix brasiliensis 5110]KIH91533.1 DNA excision repair protein ERCC-4 [Sporothrix brasiliensis 5110]